MDGNNSHTAWAVRTQAGQARNIWRWRSAAWDRKRFIRVLQWTDRIASGALPFDKPERPKGIERNVVYTMWDWASPTHYQHDAISTDKRNPTINANGLIYGSPEESTDLIPTLDPIKNIASTIKEPYLDPNPIVGRCAARTIRLLGRRGDLGRSHEHPQSDDGRGRQGLVHRSAAATGKSRLLQTRFKSSFGKGLAAGDFVAAIVALRSRDRQMGYDQHLLHDPSPLLRA